ncbi:hypothetical protein NJ959_15580, partial [Symplocastrum sp. BBK-W-15]
EGTTLTLHHNRLGGCYNKKNAKIISFTLWGDNPKYTLGAIKNADIAPIIYPGWICRFYLAPSVPQNIIAQLSRREQIEIVKLDWKSQKNWEASLWRFYPAADKDVAVMISRDTDARLNWREKAAVDEWLKSDKDFHIMRDHPLHRCPIMGGMWGVKKGVFHDIRGMIEAYLKVVDNRHIEYGIDQIFLADIIYPLVQDRSLIHDEFLTEKPFPQPRKGYEFVGQSFTEDNKIYQNNLNQLKQYIILRSQGKIQEDRGYSQETLNILSQSSFPTP